MLEKPKKIQNCIIDEIMKIMREKDLLKKFNNLGTFVGLITAGLGLPDKVNRTFAN